MQRFLIIGFVIIIITALGSFFYTQTISKLPASPSPTPMKKISPSELIPGTSPRSILPSVGTPVKVTEQNGQLQYSFPSNNPYWTTDVFVEQEKIVFVRQYVFEGEERSFSTMKKNHQEIPTKIFTPSSEDMVFVYAFPTTGVAYVVDDLHDIVDEVWKFPPMTLNDFLQLPQSAGLSLEPEAHKDLLFPE